MKNKIKFKKNGWLECECGNDEFEVTKIKDGLEFYCQNCKNHQNISIKEIKNYEKRKIY